MEGEFPEDFKCPICFEIPEKEIFQCKHGHHICDICIEHVSDCPQCRVYLGNEKIRNRKLEELLDKNKFDCSYKNSGCTNKASRKDISNHIENCPFRDVGVSFCKSLGFKCTFCVTTRNNREAVEHFRQRSVEHFFITKNESAFDMTLQGFSKFKTRSTKIRQNLIPVLFNAFNNDIIIISSYNKTTVSISCFVIENVVSDKFRVEFRIQSKSMQVPTLEWTTTPIPISQSDMVLQFPLFNFPLDLLKSSYMEHGDLVVKIIARDDEAPSNEIATNQHEMVCKKCATPKVPLTETSVLPQVLLDIAPTSPPVPINYTPTPPPVPISYTPTPPPVPISYTPTAPLFPTSYTPTPPPVPISYTPTPPPVPTSYTLTPTHVPVAAARTPSHTSLTTTPMMLPPAGAPTQSHQPLQPLGNFAHNSMVYNFVKCSYCKVQRTGVARYKCLQCDNYNLCPDCMTYNIHSFHHFAIVVCKQQDSAIEAKTKQQGGTRKPYVKCLGDHRTVYTNYIRFGSSLPNTRHRKVTDISKELFCRNCQSKPNYICLQCRGPYGLCSNCFMDENIYHIEGHYFIVTKDEKSRRFAVNILRQENIV